MVWGNKMEQIKVTDDLLKEILPKVSDELVKEWESEEIKQHTFSKRFNRKMKALIWRHKNKQLFRELCTVGKVAAALVLVVGICFFGNTMVARANLDILFKKIEVALEDASMYVYDEKTDMYYYTMYEPGYVPEGYEEVNRVVDEDIVLIQYISDKRELIQWNQLIVETGMVFGDDAEYNDVIEKKYAGDNMAICIYERGNKRLSLVLGKNKFYTNSMMRKGKFLLIRDTITDDHEDQGDVFKYAESASFTSSINRKSKLNLNEETPIDEKLMRDIEQFKSPYERMAEYEEHLSRTQVKNKIQEEPSEEN